MNWIHVATVRDGEQFRIDGVNVWEADWKMTGEVADVLDPIYSQSHKFEIWELKNFEKTIQFAAGEFSNGIWGFYLRDYEQVDFGHSRKVSSSVNGIPGMAVLLAALLLSLLYYFFWPN